MKKGIKIIYLSALLPLFVGCNDSYTQSGNNSTGVDSVQITTDASNVNQSNQKAIEDQVNIFLEWYKSKFDTLSSIMLVSIPDTDEGIYSVNFNNTEEYLKVFAKSGLFTRNFIEEKKKYFITCNDKMQKEKQNQGPPIGLEHDIILLTQEIDETLNNLGNVSFDDYSEKGNKASIDVAILYEIRIYFVKENDKWLIDKTEVVIPK